MTCQLILNWKSFAALGCSVVGIILASKLMPEQAKEALIRMFDVSEAVVASYSED